jgi:hypothetical protein
MPLFSQYNKRTQERRDFMKAIRLLSLAMLLCCLVGCTRFSQEEKAALAQSQMFIQLEDTIAALDEVDAASIFVSTVEGDEMPTISVTISAENPLSEGLRTDIEQLIRNAVNYDAVIRIEQ